MPTTAALIPATAVPNFSFFITSCQNGNMPMMSKNAGRNIANVANSPPGMPAISAPINDANVNKGPGTACVAPYPAKNVASSKYVGTSSASNSGKTTCPPPNTSDPAL